MTPVTVLGAGSWGTALAIHLARAGHIVRLWARDEALADQMAATRINPSYLPGIELPADVQPTADMDTALADAQVVVVAVPSHGVRGVVRVAFSSIPPHSLIVSATKGLEAESHQRMSQVIEDETAARFPIVVLSGPSFAMEVARGLPAAVLVASLDQRAVARVQDQFRGRGLRLYATDDVAGVEIGGALKNVIAIAAGVVEGLGLGHNAMAALITRGLAEITRLACAEGARRDTLAGLSGLGDLVVTCTGDLSRNRHVGIELGRGRKLAQILRDMHMVAEGVRTTGAALALGARHGIELPIAAQMDAVLDGRSSPLEAVETLMGRRQRAEVE